MQISVNIEQTQPLVGTASRGHARPVSFVGWLEFLRVIAELAEGIGHTDAQMPYVTTASPARSLAEARPR